MEAVMKNLSLLFVAFLLLQSTTLAQQVSHSSDNSYQDASKSSYLSPGVDTAWVRHYASGLLSGEDNADAIAVDNDGNIYVTGNSGTVKYNPSGVEQWVVQESGSELEVDASGNVYMTGNGATIKYNSSGIKQWLVEREGIDIAVDVNGNVYITNTIDGDYTTVKYNTSGVEQWEVRYDGLEDGDRAAALDVDDFGNVYVTGSIGFHGSRGSYYYEGYGTVKYNTSGIKQWVVHYTEPSGDNDHRASDIVVDESGNVYVTGYVWDWDSSTNQDYATIKYDASGVEQWVATYNGSENSYDAPKTLSVDNVGNVYVTGYSATVKYNPSGVEQWVVQESGDALAVDHLSNVYVAAHKDDNYATFKYSSSGVEQWMVYYNGTANGDDIPVALSLDNDGNVIVTGSSEGAGTESDYVTIKYNSVGEEQCLSRYNTSGFSSDRANDIAVDGSENVYVTGGSWSSISGVDYVTIKYNAAGDEQWRARYNGTGNEKDEAISLVLDVSGNVYVAGTSWDSASENDFATIKYNNDGELLWVARYNGSGNWGDRLAALGIDGSGNIYITGSSGYDYVTIKYNTAGVEQWVTTYDGSASARDEATALAIDDSGNVFITGTITTHNGKDYGTIKYNTDGEEQWVAIYNGPGSYRDLAIAIALDGSGNVFMTGSSYEATNYNDYGTIKYNSSGEEQWVARYDRSFDGAHDIAIDSYGNVYVTGKSTGAGTSADYATIKYTPEGEQLWISYYNKRTDGANAIFVDSVGNSYVTGYSTVTGTHDYNFATVKYNTFGEEQWVARYNDGEPTAIVVDGSGNVYVTGESSGRYTTIKYFEVPVSVDEGHTSVPDEYSLSHNYPNPFNPATTIKYYIPELSFVTIKVYDVLGSEVAILINEEKPIGTYEITWYAENLPSGIYFYRLQVYAPGRAGSFVETKKMVLMK